MAPPRPLDHRRRLPGLALFAARLFEVDVIARNGRAASGEKLSEQLKVAATGGTRLMKAGGSADRGFPLARAIARQRRC